MPLLPDQAPRFLIDILRILPEEDRAESCQTARDGSVANFSVTRLRA